MNFSAHAIIIWKCTVTWTKPIMPFFGKTIALNGDTVRRQDAANGWGRSRREQRCFDGRFGLEQALIFLWKSLCLTWGGDKKEVRYAICRGLSIAAVTVGQLKKRLAVGTGFASWPTVFQGGGPAVQQLRGRVKRAR